MASDEPTTPDIDLTTDQVALNQARDRRLALGSAADLIEDLIARAGSDPRWTVRVADALQGLRHAFDAHVAEVEAEAGLLPQLRVDAPRLANGIDRMYTEHESIDRELRAAADLLATCGGACEPEMVERIRAEVGGLLSSISRHRQRGADLVYEAYNVDIGGG